MLSGACFILNQPASIRTKIKEMKPQDAFGAKNEVYGGS